MKYDGMSHLKLYKDRTCSLEEDRDINGNYVLHTTAVTGNEQIDFYKNIYIKNVGSHTAYNITCTPDYAGAQVILDDETLKPTLFTKCKLIVPLTKGEKSSKTVTVQISYDNIP